MGKDARWITRWSTAIVLVGAVSAGTSGTAFGYAEGGVSVPDSTFRQGTGTQELPVSIASPVVGTDEKLVIWPFYSSIDHWLVGVTADPATGAACTYDVGQWECVPGHGGWHAGDVRVLVNTAKAMDCGLHTGVCQNDQLTVQSLPDAGDNNGLPDGQPVSVIGNVLVMPASVPWHGPTTPVYQTPAVVAAASPAGSFAEARKTSPAGSTSDASTIGLYAGALAALLVGVGAPLGYRLRRRRRRAQGD